MGTVPEDAGQTSTAAFPSTGSQKHGLLVNRDTSVDVYFGPEPPSEKEANWMQTNPGKGWFVVLRVYGPLEAWFDRSWRPAEIEEISVADALETSKIASVGAAS